MISNITIKNFRSIERMDIDCEKLTVFVGPNDAGKSNVLRALNLFFNNKTEDENDFDFERDFNQFVEQRKGKAKEIVITLDFNLPQTYRRSDGQDRVRWKKTWRMEGLYKEEQNFSDKNAFDSRSRIPAWLAQIRFDYVPAIKDQRFFADLQGQIHDVLTAIVAKTLRDSSKDFENSIGAQVKPLLDNLGSLFAGKYSVQLPESLRPIFENLQFTNDNGIPFARRGDGIKMRHIPEILDFIAEQRETIQGKGAIKSTFIWGFEEPENNLELGVSADMRDRIKNIIKFDRRQAFLTTHSPVFYKIESDFSIAKYYIKQEDRFSRKSKIAEDADDNLDEDMGLMSLVAPYIKKLTDERDDIKKKSQILSNSSLDMSKPTLFVEGKTDKKVIEKALGVFFNECTNKINVHLGDGGSKNAAMNFGKAWSLLQKQQREQVRGAVLIDQDLPRAKKNNEQLNNEQLNEEHVKLFKWGKNSQTTCLIELNKKKFIVPFDLEAFYSDEIWLKADKRGWLEGYNQMKKRLPEEFVDLLCDLLDPSSASLPDPYQGLTKAQQLRVKKNFSHNGKEETAKYIYRLSTDQTQEALSDMKPKLKEILNYGNYIHIEPSV